LSKSTRTLVIYHQDLRTFDSTMLNDGIVGASQHAFLLKILQLFQNVIDGSGDLLDKRSIIRYELFLIQNSCDSLDRYIR